MSLMRDQAEKEFKEAIINMFREPKETYIYLSICLFMVYSVTFILLDWLKQQL